MEFRFRIEGREICVPRLSLRNKYEAEKALGLGMTDNETTAILVPLVVGIHMEDPERSWVSIADEVLEFDLFSVEEVKDEEDDSPFEAATDPTALESRRTTGLPPSDDSASQSPLKISHSSS